MNINDAIVCPKCEKNFMKKACGQPILNREMYCHFCHTYFGYAELVEKWGYDLGDFGDSDSRPSFFLSSCSYPILTESNSRVEYVPKKPVCPHKYIDQFPPFVPEIFVQYIKCMDCGEILSRDPHPRQEDDKLVATTWRTGDTVSPIDEPIFPSNRARTEAYDMVSRMFFDIPEYADGCGNQGIDIGLQGYPI